MAHEDQDHHGNSPAAWTGVTIILIAFAIGTVAFFLEVEWLVWICGILVLVGLLVGFLLGKLGYGVNGPRYVARRSDAD